MCVVSTTPTAACHAVFGSTQACTPTCIAATLQQQCTQRAGDRHTQAIL